MRYPKDSIQLSPSRDLPLLRQILRSEFVTHSQLFDFMRLNDCEHTRKSFDWRLRRLVDRALVRRQTTPGCTGEFVYSVASSAAMLLKTWGSTAWLAAAGSTGRKRSEVFFMPSGSTRFSSVPSERGCSSDGTARWRSDRRTS